MSSPDPSSAPAEKHCVLIFGLQMVLPSHRTSISPTTSNTSVEWLLSLRMPQARVEVSWLEQMACILAFAAS